MCLIMLTLYFNVYSFFFFNVCVCRVVTPGPQQRHGDAANDSAPLPAAPGPLPLPAETAQPQTPGPGAPAQPQAC